jgi:hypothetical protein
LSFVAFVAVSPSRFNQALKRNFCPLSRGGLQFLEPFRVYAIHDESPGEPTMGFAVLCHCHY